MLYSERKRDFAVNGKIASAVERLELPLMGGAVAEIAFVMMNMETAIGIATQIADEGSSRAS